MQAKSAFTNLASVSDIQIQKKCSHIIIKVEGPNVVNNEKINISLAVDGSQDVLIPKIRIRDAAIKSQYQNGYIFTQKKVDNRFDQVMVIELTKNGRSIDLSNNAYLSIDLDGLDAANTYAVFGLESPMASRVYVKTSTESVSGAESQQKLFTLKNACESLFIRNNGGLSSLRVWFATGEECTYLPIELDVIARETNLITESADKIIEGDSINQVTLNGSSEMYFFPLAGVVAYEVTTVGGTDVVLFREELRSF